MCFPENSYFNVNILSSMTTLSKLYFQQFAGFARSKKALLARSEHGSIVLKSDYLTTKLCLDVNC